MAPIWMTAVARVSKHPWAATIMTGLYTAVHLIFTWTLQLVPAEPKLGPVYQKITHLVPPEFPLLLIVPAIVFDVVRRRIGGWSRWAQSAALGSAVFASFLAAQWPFANFLMSPASRNWFFSTANYPYFMSADSAWVRDVFCPRNRRPPALPCAWCRRSWWLFLPRAWASASATGWAASGADKRRAGLFASRSASFASR